MNSNLTFSGILFRSVKNMHFRSSADATSKLKCPTSLHYFSNFLPSNVITVNYKWICKFSSSQKVTKAESCRNLRIGWQWSVIIFCNDFIFFNNSVQVGWFRGDMRWRERVWKCYSGFLAEEDRWFATRWSCHFDRGMLCRRCTGCLKKGWNNRREFLVTSSCFGGVFGLGTSSSGAPKILEAFLRFPCT